MCLNRYGRMEDPHSQLRHMRDSDHNTAAVCSMQWDANHTEESKVSLEGPTPKSSLFLFTCNATKLIELLPAGCRTSLRVLHKVHCLPKPKTTGECMSGG